MNRKFFAIWLVVSVLTVAAAVDTFLHRLRNSEHIGASERSFAAHAKRVPIGSVTEKAKYEHRKDVIKLQRSQPDVVHSVVFSIQQRNIDRLEDILLDVSDPQSVNYGKHLTYEEVQELTANPEGTQRLLNFLESAKSKHKLDYKITKQSLNGEFVTVEAPIKLWETLFSAEFHEFSCDDVPDVHFHRALQYTIPVELNKHISSVFNTVQMPDLNSAALKRIRASKRHHLSPSYYAAMNGGNDSLSDATTTSSISPQATRELKGYVTPALLKRIYNIDSNNGFQLGSQAVYETIGQTFSPTDLTLFQKQFALPLEAVSHVIGGHSDNHACAADHGNNCIEANLDVQYLMAVANNVPTTYYYWSGDDFLLDWIQQVADMASPPLVFSISYGVDETELPASYGRDFDVIAMKLGVRGTDCADFCVFFHCVCILLCGAIHTSFNLILASFLKLQ